MRSLTSHECIDPVFEHKIKVRIDDINFGNHLDSSKLSSLLHNTRALFLESHGQNELNCFGVSLILLNLNINYKNQAFFNDELILKLSLVSVDGAKILFSYIVSNYKKNIVIATAETLMATFSIEKQRIVKPSKDFLHFLKTIKN